MATEPREHLQRLMENAIDFASTAVDDFDQRLKHSVVSFAAAVELFLKARLLMEHWTLVVAKRELSKSKFEAGDFVSVSLEEAAARLKDVVAAPLLEQELAAFKRLSNHRNRMLHFFHHSEHGAKEQITSELLVCWYYLYELLSGRWSKEFASWHAQLVALDAKVRRFRPYLAAIYRAIVPTLKQRELAGVVIKSCPSCGYTARTCEDPVPLIYESHCQVCRYEDVSLDWECEACGESVELRGEGYGRCECGQGVTPSDLVRFFGRSSFTQKDDLTAGLPANCSLCDNESCVVRGPKRLIFCTACLSTFEEGDIEHCTHCGAATAGGLRESYWSGCQSCDGAQGAIDDE